MTANNSANAHRSYDRTVPKLADLSRDVLFSGTVWEDPTLSPRERSLITVAALQSTYRPKQLQFHFRKAIENGITIEELSALVTHLAFYAGWPAAVTAAEVLDEIAHEND